MYWGNTLCSEALHHVVKQHLTHHRKAKYVFN